MALNRRVVQGATPEQLRARDAAKKTRRRSTGAFAGEGGGPRTPKNAPDLRSLYADCPEFWNPPSGYRGPKWSDASTWGQPCPGGGGGVAEIPEDVGESVEVAFTPPDEEGNEALELAAEEVGSDLPLGVTTWRGQTLFELAADLNERAQQLFGDE